MSNYIRKIDELGRIVIPKEIRNQLKIQENESILINLDDNKINILKYSYLNNYNHFIKELCNQLVEIYKIEIIVTDQEKTIYSNYTGNFKSELQQDIIKDSIKIGKIKFYSNGQEELSKLIKIISRIIPIFLTIA